MPTLMHEVATELRQILSGSPAPVLPSASIAPRRPSAAGDLPAIAISVDVDRADELGFGRLVRASELLANGSVREDLRGDRFAGTVAFEVWADDPGEADTLSRRLAAKLRAARPALRERGFATLRPAALDAIEGLRQPSSGGATFSAWRQRLAYRFVFEGIEGGELTDDGVIRRVDVDVPPEPFSVPPQ